MVLSRRYCSLAKVLELTTLGQLILWEMIEIQRLNYLRVGSCHLQSFVLNLLKMVRVERYLPEKQMPWVVEGNGELG
jgi:hypothetical protein